MLRVSSIYYTTVAIIDTFSKANSFKATRFYLLPVSVIVLVMLGHFFKRLFIWKKNCPQNMHFFSAEPQSYEEHKFTLVVKKHTYINNTTGHFSVYIYHIPSTKLWLAQGFRRHMPRLPYMWLGSKLLTTQSRLRLWVKEKKMLSIQF